MASFYIPLTGLETDSTALNTIANNLANLNTTGYKAQTVNFADLIYNQVGEAGNGDLIQMGSGVGTAGIESDFSQGGTVASNNSTDMELVGNGFFVLNDGGSNIYTRDGNFGIDANNGNLTTQSGLEVMGYPAVNGVVNTNSPLAPINIPYGQVEPPQATSSLGMTINLSASAAVLTSVPGTVQIYDSLGQSHVATVTYTKTGTDPVTQTSTWSYSMALSAGDATGSANTTGTLTFDSSGNLMTPAANVTGISFTGLADGAADLNLTWNVTGTNGTSPISQTSAASGQSAQTQDGYPSGEYQSFSVGSDGTVTATFSNGNKLAVGQLAMANVTNQQGLELLGGGNYATTLSSGAASVSTSGTAGLGTVSDNNLEGSNVNISAEFSDLIIAQRGFEANSKAVTTFDTVAQETINMIH